MGDGLVGARQRCATRGLAASSRCATWHGNGLRPIHGSGRPWCGSTKRAANLWHNRWMGSWATDQGKRKAQGKGQLKARPMPAHNQALRV